MRSCGWSKKASVQVGAMVAVFLPVWISVANGMNQDTQSDSMNDNAQSTMLVQPAQEKKMVSKDVLGYEMEMIDGTKRSLEEFRGKVVLMVNVASECGLTPQYEALEALYRKHKKDGLVIIGFPANEFGAQEPGSNEEIALFCSSKFDVTFPMTAKIHVKGKEVHPLFKQLAAQPEPIGGEPEWNFAKFVVNRKGEVVGRFSSRTAPDDEEVLTKLSELLQE